jgi:tetratricopeptide (TPR) repeat protein
MLLGGWAVSRRPPSSASNDIGRIADLEQRDVQITVWRKALAADSSSAIALGQLAGLYMQRGRESGDESNYIEAESLARRSLGERTNRNRAAFSTLASALLAQHKFSEADSIVEVLVGLEPDVPQYRSMRGEIKLEIGDYEGARAAFDSLKPYRTHLSIAPRLARWMEVSGDTPAARRLIRDALDEAKKRRDIPREQLAWFYLRAGDLEMRNGRMNGATKAFHQGLEIESNDYRLLAAMARLESLRGRPRKAIEFGERAMLIKLDPATLGIIGDAYAALGDSMKAEEYFRTMEISIAGEPGAFHRAWSLFLLDHNRRIDEVLANARAELETRRDVYGYDILAWALHRSGRHAEAREAMTEALRMGTRDAMLLYHDGVIRHALGDFAGARKSLRLALEINPRFHPTQPADARRLIDEIESDE